MATRRTTSSVLGLVFAALLPSLACDTSVQPDTRRAFAAAGLRIADTELVRADDGTRIDRRHAAFEANRGLRKNDRTRERLQVVRPLHPEVTTETVDEIVLFNGRQQASDFLVAHGVDPGQPGLRPGGTTPAGLGVEWLAPPPPIATADDFTLHPEGPGVIGADDFLGHGAGHAGADDFASGETPSVVRYVMNDALPLHAQASFGSDTLMSMQRGDRVFVLATAPVLAADNVFVQVQAADRAPYPVGWMPLHWLVVTPVGDAPVEVNFKATYGLMAKLGRELVEDTFYKHCDQYPTYPQDAVVGGAPELESPGSIPYAERYECGEYPVGTVESASRKHLTTFGFDTPPVYYEIIEDKPIIDIEALHFDVPVKLYRLPWQTRETYTMRDMSSGTYEQFGDGSADVIEHSHYQKFAGDALVDEPARVHDTDVWFNVTWEAPAGVDAVPDASAYFNLCWNLPGGRLEGETSDVDIDIYGGLAHSHVTGVYWGVVDFAPFRVCATAALRPTPDGISGPDVFTTGPASPIQVELVRASLHDVSVTYSQPLEVYGHFEGIHALPIEFLRHFLAEVGQNEGIMGVVFDAFVKERLEDALSTYLYDAASRLAQGLPDPEAELRSACNRLMPASYREPTSRWYPFYQHCIEAAQHADVTLFSNSVEHAQSCHVPGAYARANDGSAWSSASDDHDVYYVPPDEDDPIGIDRPYWVGSCGVRATVDTTVMSGYEDLLECAASVFNEGVNYRKSQSWIATHAQSSCLTPAVGLLCELYGEGDDLVDMWSTELGVTPNLDGYTGFCDWYASLTAPDLPDYTTEVPPSD